MTRIELTPASEIPLNQLIASSANVRRIKSGVSVEELAEDIARRGLLQSLAVRPVIDDAGRTTGMYAVSAGGRRFAALQLLVQQQRLSNDEHVPCIIKTEGIEVEDSLAENVMREGLHPLDQFRAFRSLVDEQKLSIEEVAARFFVSPQIVRQRLKLAAASPKLLDLYVADAISLDQLMAFCVTDDHSRQEEVWGKIQRGYNKDGYMIRRLLTEGAVKGSDKRVIYVGAEAYEGAGGIVLRDLFANDGGGWFQDIALLDRLAREKLATDAASVAAQGWKWTEVGIDFPYGHTNGLGRLVSTPAEVTEAEQARYDAALKEYAALSDEYEGAEELPEAIDIRMGELEREIAIIDERPAEFNPTELAYAGAFISIDHTGGLRVECGFVRPEDEMVRRGVQDGSVAEGVNDEGDVVAGAPIAANNSPSANAAVDDEADTDAPAGKLSDRLTAELTAHRTLALRDALANDPATAFVALTHGLVLKTFYGFSAHNTCLEIEARSTSLGSHAPDLTETAPARRIDKRHNRLFRLLPRRSDDLWNALVSMDQDNRAHLFAHCVGASVNALDLSHVKRKAELAHADALASHLSLDITRDWSATVGSFFGKVTKAQILATVREAKGDATARMIDHLKKGDMAIEAERLLTGTSWLPPVLRTTGFDTPALPLVVVDDVTAEFEVGGDLPAFLMQDNMHAGHHMAAE